MTIVKQHIRKTKKGNMNLIRAHLRRDNVFRKQETFSKEMMKNVISKPRKSIRIYKNLEHLRQEALKNNGKLVEIWDDDGIKVGNKRYAVFEYGNIGFNFTGNEYITFRHQPYLKKQRIHNNNMYPLSGEDKFITIEYKLTEGEKKGSNNIFNFISIRETW